MFHLFFLFFFCTIYVFHQGGERAASVAVSACLALLVRLEREGSTYVSVATTCVHNDTADVVSTGGRGDGGGGGILPEVKLYYLANACLYGSSVLAEKGSDKNFDWLLIR